MWRLRHNMDDPSVGEPHGSLLCGLYTVFIYSTNKSQKNRNGRRVLFIAPTSICDGGGPILDWVIAAATAELEKPRQAACRTFSSPSERVAGCVVLSSRKVRQYAAPPERLNESSGTMLT